MTVTEKVGFEQMLTLADVDCRRGPGKKVKILARALSNDLAGDLSVAQQMLVTRTAMLEVLCTNSEARILLGQEISIDDYIAMANTQRRLLQTLGIKRVPRDVTPDPIAYARSFDEAAE